MKSIFSLRIAFLFISMTSFSMAKAGVRVGNGGGTWVCQENGGARRWIQFVDLFEAENEYGQKIASLTTDEPWALLQERYNFVMAKLPQLAPVITMSVDQLRAITRMVPQSTELTRIDDDQIRVRPAPASCANGVLFYGQIADFTFDDRLLIASDLWADASFSNLGRAALLMHEIVYKSLRSKFGDVTSSRARALVGLIFSDLAVDKMNLEVGKVLSRPDVTGSDSPMANKPFKLVCFAHIESETDSTTPGQIVYLQPSSLLGQWSASFQGFSFNVRTDALTPSSPQQLAITDLSTGIRTTSDDQSTLASFKRDARVALSLELTNTNQIVFLECRAMAID